MEERLVNNGINNIEKKLTNTLQMKIYLTKNLKKVMFPMQIKEEHIRNQNNQT